MKVRKYLVCPERVRRVPSQFSWVDQRLVRDERLSGCSPEAWAVYLFLVTVADADGLSYYSEHSLQRRLGISPEQLHRARAELVCREVLAYEAPLYQVLSLDRPLGGSEVFRRKDTEAEAVSIGEVLRGLAGGVR